MLKHLIKVFLILFPTIVMAQTATNTPTDTPTDTPTVTSTNTPTNTPTITSTPTPHYYNLHTIDANQLNVAVGVTATPAIFQQGKDIGDSYVILGPNSFIQGVGWIPKSYNINNLYKIKFGVHVIIEANATPGVRSLEAIAFRIDPNETLSDINCQELFLNFTPSPVSTPASKMIIRKTPMVSATDYRAVHFGPVDFVISQRGNYTPSPKYLSLCDSITPKAGAANNCTAGDPLLICIKNTSSSTLNISDIYYMW